jgi:hypothetical protein
MKKRRVKRYDEGGTTEAVEMPDITEEAESERRSRNLLGEQGRIIGEAMAPRRSIEKYIRQGERTPSESPRQNFGEAFSAARRSGAKSFEFGGKRYTTEMASEKKRVRSTAPTPDESAAETARLARQAKMTESSKKGDGSSAALLAIPAAAAAAAGMRRGIKEGSRRTRTEPTLSSRVRMQEIDPFDQMAMDRMTGEGGRKKGGHVKAKKMAKGGSASSRADGIAQRGKTRGRMC